MIAGLNASRAARGLSAWAPRRDEAYIGVLIDDLTTNGTIEPYRMFTSRAEYRLHLREDNADLRLSGIGHALGCVSDALHEQVLHKREAIDKEMARLHALWVTPGNALGAAIDSALGVAITRDASVHDLLRRPELDYSGLTSISGIGPAVADARVAEQVEISIKYAGYLDRQRDEIERNRRHEGTGIPHGFDYEGVRGLSAEVCSKLKATRPATIGQAQRISGVTPAAISLLLVHLKRHPRVA